MNNPILELRGIEKSFSEGAAGLLRVLRGCNLSIKAGEAVALVGQSGSGKSTLLHSVGLLEMPDAGQVLIAGQDMTKAGDAARTRTRSTAIGFVYQFHHLLPEFSAAENIMLPQLIAGVSEDVAQKRAMDLLGQVGLLDRATHRPAQLSGGEQQRVAIARALANSPKLLIADEPTGNLDPATADNVFRVLLDVVRGQGLALLMATHNLELASKMDRVFSMQAGIITEKQQRI